jgi:hypothetical protein
LSDQSGSVHQWKRVQSEDEINVDLEYSGPLVRLERSVYILACSPSLEREQESLGVQLFDVGFAGCKEFVADAARGRS